MTIVAILLGVVIFVICMNFFVSLDFSEWTSIVLTSAVIGIIQPIIRDDVSAGSMGLTFIGCLAGASLVQLLLGDRIRNR